MSDILNAVDRTHCHDWFNRRVYRIFNSENGRRMGFLTEYVDHPTVIESVAMGVQRDETYRVIGPGSLTILYKNGEQYSFDCYIDSVFSSQFGITISNDGERIYVISDIKGLWCFDKYGSIIWKTRYTSAGQVYPHQDGTVTCITGTQLILLDAEGKPLKKRPLFDGDRWEMSEDNVAVLTSENVVAVIDVKTLEPIVKISLSKLNIRRLRDLLKADEYYVLQGTELIGIFELPDGKRDLRQKEMIYLLDNSGNVIRKIDDTAWNWVSRAYVDRATNEVVLYAAYRHHTSDTYRISLL